jgi:hypothetical protein
MSVEQRWRQFQESSKPYQQLETLCRKPPAGPHTHTPEQPQELEAVSATMMQFWALQVEVEDKPGPQCELKSVR